MKTNVMSQQPRLSIIVPYRDRKRHLAKFTSHIQLYFERDKADKNVPYSVTIVEQAGGGLLNRGKLKNIGFDITLANAEYFAFHDVDYLPIWADYSLPDQPAQLVYYGTALQEAEDFFGAVTLFRKEHFRLVNGYSNGYWGWGFEDSDLRARCVKEGLQPVRRPGTYQALPHEHRGINKDKKLSPAAERNFQRFQAMRDSDHYKQDGLSSLDYQVVSEQLLTEHCKMITVDVGTPDDEQLKQGAEPSN